MSISGTTVTFTNRDGMTLVGDRWDPPGSPDGPSSIVILSHGGGQTRHSWKQAGSLLAQDGYSALSLDMRGHGDSDWSDDLDYGAKAASRDILDVMDTLDHDRVILVGASLGGLGSLEATIAAQDRVDALVLVDIVPRINPDGSKRIANFMMGAPDGFATLEEAADAIADYMPHRERRGVTPGLLKNLRQRDDGRWRWHWDPRMMNAADLPADEVRQISLERSEDLEKRATDIKVPILVLRGLLSDVVDADAVDSFVALMQNASTDTLEGAAHTAAADDNDAFTSAVVAFIDSLP